MAPGRRPDVGQLHGSAPGDPGLRHAPAPFDASHDDGWRGPRVAAAGPGPDSPTAPRLSERPASGRVALGDDQGFNESAPKTRPSELFQRNCWISFEPVESSIAVLADYIGPHKIMWATDYPHSDGFFPGAPQMLRERPGPLSPEAKHQVLAGGALGFYGLS